MEFKLFFLYIFVHIIPATSNGRPQRQRFWVGLEVVLADQIVAGMLTQMVAHQGQRDQAGAVVVKQSQQFTLVLTVEVALVATVVADFRPHQADADADPGPRVAVG